MLPSSGAILLRYSKVTSFSVYSQKPNEYKPKVHELHLERKKEYTK